MRKIIGVLLGVLWALKISGLTELSYQTLWLITIVGLLIFIIIGTLKNILKDYIAKKKLDAIEKADDDSAILTILMMIYLNMK